MPKITITNHGTNPRMYWDRHGTRFTVAPRGGAFEADMNQDDIDNLTWLCAQPDMDGVLEISGAKASKDYEPVEQPKVLADPGAPAAQAARDQQAARDTRQQSSPKRK